MSLVSPNLRQMQGARSEAYPLRYVSSAATRQPAEGGLTPSGQRSFWAATSEYFSNIAEATLRKIFHRFVPKSPLPMAFLLNEVVLSCGIRTVAKKTEWEPRLTGPQPKIGITLAAEREIGTSYSINFWVF